MMKSGNIDFDKFLEGGYSSISTIYGKAGTGKTCLCIMASIEEAKLGNKVIYIDSERGFNVDRFKQIAGISYKKVLENIFVLNVGSFGKQHEKIKEICKMKKIPRLLIIDTLGGHYRKLVRRERELANNMLRLQLRLLNGLVNKGGNILITNQVYSRPYKKGVEMVGYKLFYYYSKRVLELQNNNLRRIVFKKSGKGSFNFKICDSGIEKI